MNKLKNLILWLMIAGYMILALGFVRRENDALKCTGISIHIHDSIRQQFIIKEDILEMITEAGDSIAGGLIGRLELSHMEDLMRAHPAVKKAEIYTTVDGELRAEIWQRKPLVRIIDRSNRNYYIDEEGWFMPVSLRHSERVLVINGNISPALFKAGGMHHLDDEPDKELLEGLFDIARYMYEDEFWRSQIVQVYINEQKELELVPRLGAHIIHFGTTDDYMEKLFKLETVYREGFNFLGWNQYETINLKYKNQVVCTKK